MKRNSIFMWAYICFIIILVILRVYTEFSLWTPIVIAITISSAFFALEDLCASISKFYQDNLEHLAIAITNANKVVDQSEVYLNSADLLLSKNNTESREILHYLPQPSKLKDEITKLEEQLETAKESAKRIRKAAKKWKTSTIFFAFLGFFSLFCALIVCDFFSIPVIAQEFLSVISFAIILTTQQISENMENKIKSTQVDIDHILERVPQITTRIAEDELRIRRFLAAVEETENKEKEAVIDAH